MNSNSTTLTGIFIDIIFFVALSVIACRFDPMQPSLPIKKGESLFSSKYFSFLTSHIQQKNLERYVFVYMGDICMSCRTAWLTHQLNALQARLSRTKIYILLPNEYQDSDIRNLQFNNSFHHLTFLRIGQELQSYVYTRQGSPTPFPLTGLTIIATNEGVVSHVEDLLTSEERPFEARVEEIVDRLK